MVVRGGVVGDRAGIRRLMGELHGGGVDGVTLPEVRQVAGTFVGVGRGEVVGVVVGTLVDYGREPYGVVEELVVAREWRGMGIGGALLSACREWLGEEGAEVAFVSAVDEGAAEFYLRAGFERCVGPWLWGGTGGGRG